MSVLTYMSRMPRLCALAARTRVCHPRLEPGLIMYNIMLLALSTHPQVAPVFAIHGLPMTPTSGERFDGPGNSVTRTELAALFAVIGTPSWRCIESVANPAWRRYLRKITGRCVC